MVIFQSLLLDIRGVTTCKATTAIHKHVLLYEIILVETCNYLYTLKNLRVQITHRIHIIYIQNDSLLEL